MKHALYLSLFVLIFSSCTNKEKTYTVALKDHKDSLSYVLGAINAKTIVNSGTEAFDKLDKNLVLKGFKQNLNGTPAQECLNTLQLLFGPTYQDFNPTYVKEGSLCMGKMSGYAFFFDIRKLGALDKINFAMVKKGFEDGLHKRDTMFMKDNTMRFMMTEFMTGLNISNGNNMMAKAKKIPGIAVLEGGVLMQTIKPGSGPQPSATDDVKVHYILTSALGDTIQSSYKGDGKGNVEPIPLALNGGVIPGWTIAIPQMKVGGKYRIFIPWNLAYGEQQGKESLCFLVELIAAGKEGSFTANAKNPQAQ
jgi:FKBP-type peptidyl-prolyl cis-trans isomerase